MTIEEQLKNCILSRYKSIREFCIQNDIPYSTVDSIFKRGILGSSVSVVIKICNKLNIDVDELINGNIKDNISTTKPSSIDDDPYFGLPPKVAAELRRLAASDDAKDDEGNVIGYNGLDMSQVSQRAKDELKKLKLSDYENSKKYVYEQIDDRSKKAAVIGYDNGEKSEFFLNEQETRVVLNLIKSLRGE